ncbi:variable large family protein [Borreliella burgdorferi]|uniref:variable large family protein n=1 Tax=Borreliella burgdorferi TaxID=139 RepID=UPI0022B903E4|nr:variable large family protein [Borreliella burgdorferi]
MKKISSAILLTTFFVFINCKSQVADKASVKGIAKGIKEIVEAAGGSEKLKAVAAAAGENNKGAGKLFGKAGANAVGTVRLLARRLVLLVLLVGSRY